ncbi:hypothetical protein HDA32_005874 [Spinactinospora alkalitolerans]|uniref:Uncharacterized protein n=1 Tax=Spinactinospora alkalitolerans TaxID=687207 RepID=A0A852U9G3_9ACTN|nr:hypothetical protein [Spinactinospora alkalitolerans]NYE50754.1 hypothetical protein [Spinactinospora alkalitolerans]
MLRALLWGVFTVCLAGNVVSSLMGAPVLVDAGFGVVALLCITVLIVRYVKGRR